MNTQDVGVTTSYSEWRRAIQATGIVSVFLQFLKNHQNFMTQPIGWVNGKMLIAEIVPKLSEHEVIDYIDVSQMNNDRAFIYMIRRFSTSTPDHGMDPVQAQGLYDLHVAVVQD